MIIMIEKLLELLAGETDLLGENLLSDALSTTNSTCCPDANPDAAVESQQLTA
jgi:hypothetical protein